MQNRTRPCKWLRQAAAFSFSFLFFLGFSSAKILRIVWFQVKLGSKLSKLLSFLAVLISVGIIWVKCASFGNIYFDLYIMKTFGNGRRLCFLWEFEFQD